MKYQPVEFKVLVKPMEVEQYQGQIYIPDTVVERQQISQDKAEIVACGGNAFEDWREPHPKVGDTVLLSRHAGYRFFDKEDGNIEYRVVNDKDITLIIGEDNE